MIDNTKQLSKKTLHTSLEKCQSSHLHKFIVDFFFFFTETKNYKSSLIESDFISSSITSVYAILSVGFGFSF